MPGKTVVIHQPDFLPYIGFFHRLLNADLFVVLDTVQFLSGSKSWHNRDKIKTRDGEAWLTVPTQKAPQKTPINRILISDDSTWQYRHLNLITHNYKATPFFKEVFPYIEELYTAKEIKLMDFTMKSIDMLMNLFDIQIKASLASDIGAEGKSNELLAAILRNTGATTYLSGVGARAYFDPAPFEQAKVNVRWQDFNHPEYQQLHPPFVPFLSSVDMLFNCGIATSRTILRSC